MAAEGLKYTIDISVNKVLSETEKNLLMVALSEAVHTVLGPSKSGVVIIHSIPVQRATEEINEEWEENELEVLLEKLTRQQ